ncbi:hypothetical protein LWI28_016178 [Acer negundo]|uniref:Uncharacterized protein n=1 Tax=Acer negundo TaxID=4023 RepID=A0AAD5NI33_ACENE|nr:hypothetical protein LWI28_016178 [Acer negundo]
MEQLRANESSTAGGTAQIDGVEEANRNLGAANDQRLDDETLCRYKKKRRAFYCLILADRLRPIRRRKSDHVPSLRSSRSLPTIGRVTSERMRRRRRTSRSVATKKKKKKKAKGGGGKKRPEVAKKKKKKKEERKWEEKTMKNVIQEKKEKINK